MSGFRIPTAEEVAAVQYAPIPLIKATEQPSTDSSNPPIPNVDDVKKNPVDEITPAVVKNPPPAKPPVVQSKSSSSVVIVGSSTSKNVVVHVPYVSNYANINYAYIPDFNRFYFVSVDNLKGVRLKLTMKSDALSSFWNNYKYSQCIAKRSSSNYNTDIKDDMLAFKPQPIYIRRKTSNKFTPSSSGYCYVLTLGGK